MDGLKAGPFNRNEFFPQPVKPEVFSIVYGTTNRSFSAAS
jgi:hypothetical protein